MISSALFSSCLLFASIFLPLQPQTTHALLPNVRPPADRRTYKSAAIDSLIDGLTSLLQDEDLAVMLSNCLPNTLDTTVAHHSSGTSAADMDSFIVTGDINALWLRDSTNQVIPYIPYATKDAGLQSLLEGLIARQARSINIDPFANAFNYNASGQGHQLDQRVPHMTASVFEGKYEIDSLCAFLKLSYWHWRYSGDEALLRYADSAWIAAVSRLLDTGKLLAIGQIFAIELSRTVHAK